MKRNKLEMKKIIFSLAAAVAIAACTPTKVTNTSTETMNTTKSIDRSVMPKPGPAPKVNIGKSQSFTLENGLKVMVVENNKLPRVSFNLTLDNPPVREGNKKGVRDLLSSMMGNGTSKMSKDDYNEEIEFYGARVNMNAGGAYASTLSKFFPQVLDLVADGVLDPLLNVEEFNSEKNKLMESLKADEKNVSSVASNLRDALVFGMDHPFGEFVNDKTVQNVNFEDVKSYYAKNFVPGNAYLVVVGDVSFEDVKNQVTQKFGKWKKGTIADPKNVEPKNLTTAQINFVDMPNAVQSEVATLNVTNLKMTDPDYFATLMANQILGGGGEGRLFLNLRETHGWTYGSYSSIRGDKDVNKFMTTASVRNAVTDSAVVEMLNELSRIKTELVSDEELQNAKAKYIGNFVMQVEKPEVIARQALQTETQNLPADYYENYIANINAVTKEDVRRAAQKYFSNDNARIVVVGKSDEVLDGLNSLNIPIKYFDRYGNEVEAPKKKEVSADVTAMGVVNKYLKAIGGKDKAKALKSTKTTFTMEMPGAPPGIGGELIQMAPNKEKMVIKMGEMVMQEQVFDGEVLRAGGQELSGEQVADKVAVRGLIPQAFYKDSEVKLNGISQVNGKDAYRLDVTLGGNTTSEYYDVNSGLLVQSTVTQSTPQGEMAVNTLFEDYKMVDGINLPHKIVQQVGGQNVVMILNGYTINSGVSDADFQ